LLQLVIRLGTTDGGIGEQGSKKLININTSVLTTPGTSSASGRNPSHGENYSKGMESSQLPCKTTGTSCCGEIRDQTGHHKFHPATIHYITTDRWLPEGFLVSISI